MVKVHIAFRFTDSPFGGGNQFLKSLKSYFQAIGVYEENTSLADVILFNSHHHITEAAKLKRSFPDKVFIHRIDGPMKVYNSPADRRDNIIFAANKFLADATVFQSAWSQQKNHELKLPKIFFETVIHNAPDAKIFNDKNKSQFSNNRKANLIAASWSSNWNKGFETYKWLDENLDFSKYQMTFIGNSPVKFKNIEHLPPLNSKQLAEKFKQNDILIFASPMEACSNLLLEAMGCGLPVIAPNSSSNPEIVAKGGQLFDKPSDIPSLLEKIVDNYPDYASSIKLPSIKEVGKAYYDFIQEVYGKSSHKKFDKLAYLCLITEILFWKTVNKIRCR